MRIGTLALTLCLLINGCSNFPFTSSSYTTQPQRISLNATPLTATSIKDPTSLNNSLTKIPLQVGYGVHGQWFDLYFTDPTDTGGKQLSGGLDDPLIAAIDSARLSVDAAIYSLSLNSVRDSLIHAFRRGVAVRIVMESDNMDSADPQTLIEAGIPILGDRHQGLMHNKFVVIDRSEVWTGSMNYTNDGAYADNNNLIRISSRQMAEDYESKFTEMFVNDKFSPDSGGQTPYPRVIVDDTPIDIYFSPGDHVQASLVDLLDNAQNSIYFLAYSFTADPLGDAIRQRAKSGVKVSGVMEAEQVASNVGSEYDKFRADGLDVHMDGNRGQMHHKVMIIDNQIVVTGSYNFTASAENTNDENLIVIYNTDIASQYFQEFQRVYALAQP